MRTIIVLPKADGMIADTATKNIRTKIPNINRMRKLSNFVTFAKKGIPRWRSAYLPF